MILLNFSRPARRTFETLPNSRKSFCAVRGPMPGYAVERRFCLARGAPLAVKSDSEAVRLVADLLDEVQNRRVMFENNRLVFLSEDVQNFFFLCDARERLIDDLQRIERLRGSVQLADAAVNQNQTWERLFFFLQAPVAARHRFAHAGEVVVLRNRIGRTIGNGAIRILTAALRHPLASPRMMNFL